MIHFLRKTLLYSRTALAACTLAVSSISISAQQSRADFAANHAVCGDNYLAYPEPVGVSLTPAPKGYTPCYITHYGRHGSRWLIGKQAYDKAYDVLSEARDSGQLTPLGTRLMMQIDTLRRHAHGRDGELTRLGARQHRGIAHRMYERFPQLFAGGMKVEARSSTSIRCILSMNSELNELKALSPNIDIDADAAAVDMYFINNRGEAKKKEEREKTRGDMDEGGLDAFRKRHFSPERLLNSLFVSQDYWQRKIERPTRFAIDEIWKLHASMQGLEPQQSTDLSSYFTEDELYNIWLIRNAEWYISHGPSPFGDGKQISRQRHLVRQIIEKADSCLAMPEGNGRVTASLRFGHEVVVMPTVCFLNLNGYGKTYDNLEQLEPNGWYSYRIFPMASNIQMVFYRKPGSPVLVRVLLNEREATMPQLKPAYGSTFYKWDDVRAYCIEKIKEETPDGEKK